jgi:hypothetical protein
MVKKALQLQMLHSNLYYKKSVQFLERFIKNNSDNLVNYHFLRNIKFIIKNKRNNYSLI